MKGLGVFKKQELIPDNMEEVIIDFDDERYKLIKRIINGQGTIYNISLSERKVRQPKKI